MNVIFIVPCRNAAGNLPALINSVLAQQDQRWQIIMVDDCSTDSTWEVMQQLASTDSRIECRQNIYRCYALQNIVTVAREFEEDPTAVVAVIDGDDQLCNPTAVGLLLNEYEDGADVVWTAHRWDINNMNISRKMPDSVNPYQWPWSSSHLRTFRATLISRVSNKNFQDTLGQWFRRGYDQALMLPLLYITNRRSFINEVCYLYNIESVSVDDRDWAEKGQHGTINLVRARGFLR